MLKQQQQKKKKINSYVILPMGRLLYLDIKLKKKKRKNYFMQECFKLKC